MGSEISICFLEDKKTLINHTPKTGVKTYINRAQMGVYISLISSNELRCSTNVRTHCYSCY